MECMQKGQTQFGGLRKTVCLRRISTKLYVTAVFTRLTQNCRIVPFHALSMPFSRV
jgi:hypothetical protein